MDFKKLNETALNSARQALITQFDWNAFMVYSMALQNLKETQTDDIAETDIDDNIKYVFDDFVKYHEHKSKGENTNDDVEKMLKSFDKIIIELYYQSTHDEKKMISECLQKLNAICT